MFGCVSESYIVLLFLTKEWKYGCVEHPKGIPRLRLLLDCLNPYPLFHGDLAQIAHIKWKKWPELFGHIGLGQAWTFIGCIDTPQPQPQPQKSRQLRDRSIRIRGTRKIIMKRDSKLPSSKQPQTPNSYLKRMEKLVELNEEHRLLICQLCSNAIRPGKSIEGHFRAHRIKGSLLRDIVHYCSIMDLQDPLTIAVPTSRSKAVQSLPLLSGFRCTQCHFMTIAKDNTTRH